MIGLVWEEAVSNFSLKLWIKVEMLMYKMNKTKYMFFACEVRCKYLQLVSALNHNDMMDSAYGHQING